MSKQHLGCWLNKTLDDWQKERKRKPLEKANISLESKSLPEALDSFLLD